MTLADHPRVPLLFGPSPVHRLERLSAHLGGAVDVWAKREDCNSGLAYGGNKVRKLEYLVAEALATGCDTLVSIGGVQSNHTRQVAAVAARLGLGCVLVQEQWVDWPVDVATTAVIAKDRKDVGVVGVRRCHRLVRLGANVSRNDCKYQHQSTSESTHTQLSDR